MATDSIDSVDHIYMEQDDGRSSPETQGYSQATPVSSQGIQVSSKTTHVSSQGTNIKAIKSTRLRTESGLEITKHEYIELHARAHTQPLSVPVQPVPSSAPVVRTQRGAGPPAYYDVFPKQNRGIETQPVRLPEPRVNRFRQRVNQDDDQPTFLICCALFLSVLALACLVSILCGVPALILACKALWVDPETSRTDAKFSICCSGCGIISWVAVVILLNVQY